MSTATRLDSRPDRGMEVLSRMSAPFVLFTGGKGGV
jgi:hypothetical protein